MRANKCGQVLGLVEDLKADGARLVVSAFGAVQVVGGWGLEEKRWQQLELVVGDPLFLHVVVQADQILVFKRLIHLYISNN